MMGPGSAYGGAIVRSRACRCRRWLIRIFECEMGDYTVGVEEEYQLVCPETGELRSRAQDVLSTDWSGEIIPENQQTMLEIGTRICGSAADLGQEIRRLRLQVASTAAAEDLSSMAAGIHPFSRWEAQSRTPGERYEKLLERYGRVIRSEQIFGMHIHVAVPEGVDRVQIMNQVRGYIPHLLALSASSPIYEGEDTGYASYRTILGHRLPHTGPPPQFPSEESFNRFVRLMISTGVIADEYTFYWSIRPHPAYPTLEFRVTDACPRVDDAVVIAAIARALVAAAVENRLPSVGGLRSVSVTDELLSHNEWQAARYGLDALRVDPALSTGCEPLRDSILRLRDQLQSVSESLGDGSVLLSLEELLSRGNGATRIRETFRSCGSLPAVVEWLVQESVLGTGLDRRRAQREVREGSGRCSP